MFLVVGIKDGKQLLHNCQFSTLRAALAAGHELTRDMVFDFFKVERY